MSNIWYLIHQTPKTNVHKIFQISKFLHATTVHSQIWDGTDKNAKVFFLILFTFCLTSQHISLSSSGSLNSHLCLTLSIALSQPRWSHHNDHHAVLPSFMPSTMPHHAASPSLLYHPPCHAAPPSLPCHPPRHVTPSSLPCHPPATLPISHCVRHVFSFVFRWFFFFFFFVGFIVVAIDWFSWVVVVVFFVVAGRLWGLGLSRGIGGWVCLIWDGFRGLWMWWLVG